MSSKMSSKKGFSLIEILVVIAILGIISAIAIPSYRDYNIKSKLSRGVFFLKECQKKITNYYLEYDEFPDTVCGVDANNTESIGDGVLEEISYETWSDDGTEKAAIYVAFSPSIISEASESNLSPSTVYNLTWYDIESDTFKSLCGQYDSSHLPSSYLNLMPEQCRDENIYETLETEDSNDGSEEITSGSDGGSSGKDGTGDDESSSDTK